MSILILIFGILITLLGYRYYGYCVGNFEPNTQRSKNLGIAVILIMIGLFLFTIAIISFFNRDLKFIS